MECSCCSWRYSLLFFRLNTRIAPKPSLTPLPGDVCRVFGRIPSAVLPRVTLASVLSSRATSRDEYEDPEQTKKAGRSETDLQAVSKSVLSRLLSQCTVKEPTFDEVWTAPHLANEICQDMQGRNSLGFPHLAKYVRYRSSITFLC